MDLQNNACNCRVMFTWNAIEAFSKECVDNDIIKKNLSMECCYSTYIVLVSSAL